MTLREEAILYVEEDIRIHQQWIEYEKKRRRIRPPTGDVMHHEKWVKRLTIILEALKEKP